MIKTDFMKLYEELSELQESKADIDRLVVFAGQELADRFLAIKNKITPPENDLYYWIKNKTPEELDLFVSTIEDTESRTQTRKTAAHEGAELVCETDHWKVYHITTAAAAQLYGRDTKWCISGVKDGENIWRSYADYNDIFFLFAKSSYDARGCSNKFALVIDPGRGYYEAFDQQDNKLEDMYEIPFIDEIEIPDYFPLEELEPWPEDDDDI